MSHVSATAEVGCLLVGEVRQNVFHRLGLHGCPDVVQSFFIKMRRGREPKLGDKVTAHAKLDHAVAQICQRGHADLTDVDWCCHVFLL